MLIFNLNYFQATVRFSAQNESFGRPIHAERRRWKVFSVERNRDRRSESKTGRRERPGQRQIGRRPKEGFEAEDQVESEPFGHRLERRRRRSRERRQLFRRHQVGCRLEPRAGHRR